MTSKAREFIDFWIENSVHATEEHGGAGSEQSAAVLAERCVEMAGSIGITRQELDAEVGDLVTYLHTQVKAANQRERDRPDRSRP
jgi:hypothetical protein